MGNQLIAEYDPPSGQYYYYTMDRISSTRIVTDGTGGVYAAAHNPYGGIQKTWVSSFDPVPKFSGKEHDGESQLDYFGARYYDRSQYRFISTDPQISINESLHNPQMMNLYSVCIGNPISNMDPNGRGVVPVQLPGVNGTTLTSWLDARFAERVDAFIAVCRDIGIQIEVTVGYRTQETQDKYVRMGLTKAKASLHSAGWAIDINWNAFGSNELVEMSVITAAAMKGIDWGGYFPDPDVVHFYAEPSEKRATLIKCAIAPIETYNAFGVAGLSDRELHMLYGVFTADAAYRVIDAAVDNLKN